MKELIALLIMLADSLLTFMDIHIEFYSQSIVIIIYNKSNEVEEYESFRWNTDFDKNIVLKRAINWLVDQAYLKITKGDNHREDHPQNIISTSS